MQCEYVTSRGQCPNEAEKGSFCADHSATSHKSMLNQYRIAGSLIGESADRHSRSEDLKSIRGEIAIMRSLLETRINTCTSDAELVSAMPVIRDAALAIEKMAVSCHTMDVKLGNLIDKQALMQLAQRLIGIISKYVRPFENSTPTTEDIDLAIEAVGQELVEAIAQQENIQ